MSFSREPRIHTVPILELRPTQITVGMREVKAKRASWRQHPDRKKPDFLGNHLIPVIWGPKGAGYIIDHHHLALALHHEGVKEVATTIVADLRALPREAFWVYLDNRGWMHPFDTRGRRRSYQDLPKRITGLEDDPYRSLAGELRLAGGFAKDTTPFSEFLWADFLRRRVGRKLIKGDFDDALRLALKLARSPEAGYLPGWCGPSVSI
ncbi:MAG TPA: ParB-like protein [Steroidobacteraceae bacterium]|nr:ParB-like protein [Steroidobacteraceae bacterium]